MSTPSASRCAARRPRPTRPVVVPAHVVGGLAFRGTATTERRVTGRWSSAGSPTHVVDLVVGARVRYSRAPCAAQPLHRSRRRSSSSSISTQVLGRVSVRRVVARHTVPLGPRPTAPTSRPGSTRRAAPPPGTEVLHRRPTERRQGQLRSGGPGAPHAAGPSAAPSTGQNTASAPRRRVRHAGHAREMSFHSTPPELNPAGRTPAPPRRPGWRTRPAREGQEAVQPALPQLGQLATGRHLPCGDIHSGPVRTA